MQNCVCKFQVWFFWFAFYSSVPRGRFSVVLRSRDVTCSCWKLYHLVMNLPCIRRFGVSRHLSWKPPKVKFNIDIVSLNTEQKWINSNNHFEHSVTIVYLTWDFAEQNWYTYKFFVSFNAVVLCAIFPSLTPLVFPASYGELILGLNI